MGWGIPASILLHVVLVAAFFVHLPVDQPEPEKEESVQVEIVPPPEEPEKKPEEQKPAEKKAEQKKPEEKKPPEPVKQEEAKKAEPPPPPPEPPKQEEAKKQQPPPPPKQEKQEPSATEQERQRLAAPRRVFEFGEKDGGPKKSANGNASRQTVAPTAAEKTDEQPTDVPKLETRELFGAKEPNVEKPSTNAVPDEIKVPEIGVASATPVQNGSHSAAPDATNMAIVAMPAMDPMKTEPIKTPRTELTEAKTLFSQHMTGDVMATVAIAGMPRAFRAGELCSTELEAQLRNASYNVKSWPRPRLPKGTVLDVQNVGFSANNQWYDLSFRCVIDEGATKVVSFAFKVGAPVPRSQWRARGFPE